MQKYRVNNQIRCPSVMLLRDGANLGIFSTDEAKKIALQAELDLVEVSPNSNPPVCRIMDYGKFKYEQSLKEKEQKKKQHKLDKSLRLSPSIGDHDLGFKISAAQKFLEKGFRVSFSLMYKKREHAHKELGFKVADKIIQALEQVGNLINRPKIEGGSLNFIIEPKK